MRKPKTVLVVRYLDMENNPFSEADVWRLKETLEVDLIMITAEENKKEHIDYPSFEIVEL